MGFWAGLGKGLLKVAPIAANFIPGVGPLASMGIQAGLGAANAKAGGGGWKQALIGAGTGAAMSKFGGGGSKGLAPSKGFWGTLGNIGKQTGEQILGQGGYPYIMDSPARGGIGGNMGGGWQDALSNILSGPRGNQQGGNLGNRVGLPPYVMNMQDTGGTAIPRNPQTGTAIPRGPGPARRSAIARVSERPNVGGNIERGRQEAMRLQSWRSSWPQ